MVVFDDQFHMSSRKVKINGGKADKDEFENGCKNGGSGSVYYKFNDTLVVNNAEMNSTAFTFVKVPTEKELVD